MATSKRAIFDAHEVELVHNVLAQINPYYHTNGPVELMSRVEHRVRASTTTDKDRYTYLETNGWCATPWFDEAGDMHIKLTLSAYGVHKHLFSSAHK